MSSSTSTRTMTLTLDGIARDKVAEVQAEVTRILDSRAIVESVTGSGGVIVFRVTFGNAPESVALSQEAGNAALRITPCDYRLSAL